MLWVGLVVLILVAVWGCGVHFGVAGGWAVMSFGTVSFSGLRAVVGVFYAVYSWVVWAVIP